MSAEKKIEEHSVQNQDNLVDRFYHFILMMNILNPKDEIDHSAWSTCAVGEFCKLLGGDFNANLYYFIGGLSDKGILYETQPAFYNALNRRDGIGETYGELCQAMQKLWVK